MDPTKNEGAFQFLRSRKQRIFENWIAVAKRQNAKVNPGDPLLIKNSFPILFDRLVDELDPTKSLSGGIEDDLLCAHPVNEAILPFLFRVRCVVESE